MRHSVELEHEGIGVAKRIPEAKVLGAKDGLVRGDQELEIRGPKGTQLEARHSLQEVQLRRHRDGAVERHHHVDV